MTKEEIDQIRVMTSTAGIYHHSAQTLENVSLQTAFSTKDESIKNQSLADLTTTFLLYSLSSEISLKVILKCEGKASVRAHNLQTLFSLLDVQHQEAIKAKVNNADFDTLLRDHKDNFVSWRYFYEGNVNPIKFPFLKDFSTSVYQLARQLVLTLNPDEAHSTEG